MLKFFSNKLRNIDQVSQSLTHIIRAGALQDNSLFKEALEEAKKARDTAQTEEESVFAKGKIVSILESMPTEEKSKILGAYTGNFNKK